MKNKINGVFEKLILDGCTLIKIESLNYNATGGEFTHALLQCPKNYMREEYKDRGAVKFISVQFGEDFINPAWYEATLYFSTKSHALKSFRDSLAEDRYYNRLKKRNEETAAN